MRKSLSSLALAVCGLWSVSQASAESCTPSNPAAVNLVTNCGFESGNFNGWTIGGNILNPGGNYYGVDAFDAHSGNYGAYMSQDFVDAGTAPVTLRQTLATIPGLTYQVTFWLEQDTAPTTGYTHAFSALWGGTTILSLIPTMTSPGIVGSFAEYSIEETAIGATTLQFSFENDDQFWSFDDVSVVRTPEPSAGLLGGTGFGVLLFLWSRKRLLRS